jgi:hypothetical protein
LLSLFLSDSSFTVNHFLLVKAISVERFATEGSFFPKFPLPTTPRDQPTHKYPCENQSRKAERACGQNAHTVASTRLRAMDAKERDEKKEEKKDAGKKVSFTGLFRYADGTDMLLMLVGTVAAMANGVTQPLMTVIFGQVINAFGGATSDDVLSRVNKVSRHAIS